MVYVCFISCAIVKRKTTTITKKKALLTTTENNSPNIISMNTNEKPIKAFIKPHTLEKAILKT